MAQSLRPRKDQSLSIGTVSLVTGVEIHTLRYWEQEFADFLQPTRTPGGQRRYDIEAVSRVLEIQRLLKRERYTIDGARHVLGLSRKVA